MGWGFGLCVVEEEGCVGEGLGWWGLFVWVCWLIWLGFGGTHQEGDVFGLLVFC